MANDYIHGQFGFLGMSLCCVFRNFQKRSRLDSEIGRLEMMSSKCLELKRKKKRKTAGDNGASLSISPELNI